MAPMASSSTSACRCSTARNGSSAAGSDPCRIATAPSSARGARLITRVIVSSPNSALPSLSVVEYRLAPKSRASSDLAGSCERAGARLPFALLRPAQERDVEPGHPAHFLRHRIVDPNPRGEPGDGPRREQRHDDELIELSADGHEGGGLLRGRSPVEHLRLA